MPAIVASENTTPNPNVSSGRFRSITRIWCRGSAFFISAAKYRPPGPPPTQTMRITASRGVRPGHGHRGSGEHRENEPQRHKDTEVLCVSVSPWLNYPLRARAGSVNSLATTINAELAEPAENTWRPPAPCSVSSKHSTASVPYEVSPIHN